MKKLRYSRRAQSDLEAIVSYTARTWGAAQAKQYIGEIRAHIEELSNNEAFYQPLPVQRPDMFKSRINRHLIIFEVTQTHVSIVRILHEAMDIPRHIPRSHQ